MADARDFSGLLSDCGAAGDTAAIGKNLLFTSIRAWRKQQVYDEDSEKQWQAEADHIAALIGAVKAYTGPTALKLSRLRNVSWVQDINYTALAAAWGARIDGELMQNVTKYWPIISRALHADGMTGQLTKMAALATVHLESSFNPNAQNLESAKYEDARGGLYRARGFLQLFGDYNYETYGKKLGFDLLGNPDLVFDPEIGASVLASYFKLRGVDTAAQARNWYGVREAVFGRGKPAVMEKEVSVLMLRLQPLLDRHGALFRPG